MNVEVTAAIIRDQDKLLICQRASEDDLPDLWEFPGGKLEPGETLEDCIRREIQEELCLRIEPVSVFGTTCYPYKDKMLNFTFFNAVRLDGQMRLLVHRDARWVGLEALGDYVFMPGDVPVVEALRNLRGLSEWPVAPMSFEIDQCPVKGDHGSEV